MGRPARVPLKAERLAARHAPIPRRAEQIHQLDVAQIWCPAHALDARAHGDEVAMLATYALFDQLMRSPDFIARCTLPGATLAQHELIGAQVTAVAPICCYLGGANPVAVAVAHGVARRQALVKASLQ